VNDCPATSVVCLVGPTGAGKTALALALARELGGGVINIDSRQVYADFPIITAQPSAREQDLCPHRLYGFLPCDQKITAGAFVELAGRAIAETAAQGLVPLLVGGAGLYLRALLQGLAPIPPVPAEVAARLLAELAARGLPELRARLEAADPAFAARIHPNDTQRTLRALEVFEATGRPLSAWHALPAPGPGYRALKLGLAPADMAGLAPRLERRIEMMITDGALEEAREAWRRCPDPKAPAWSSIGCAELLGWLRGVMDLDQAMALWLRNTRAYAKRQMTWFRKERDLRWLDPSADDAEPQALDLARIFLGGAV